MELKKLMEHISIIPDYRQAWKVEHKLSDILLSTLQIICKNGWRKHYGEPARMKNGPLHRNLRSIMNYGCKNKFMRLSHVLSGTDAKI